MNVAVVFLVIAASALGTEAKPSVTSNAFSKYSNDPAHSTTLVDIFRKDDALWYRECNGVLVDPRWVLTPSYCVRSEGLESEYKIVYQRAEIPVKDVFRPEEFVMSYIDVALLRLGHPLTNVTYLILPPADFVVPPTLSLYTWGRRQNIKVIEVKVQNETQCKDFSLFPDIHICAGDKINSTVQGQEGSPVVVRDLKKPDTLVGVLLSAHAYPAPAVYTRISRYTSWITKTIGRDEN